MARNFTLSAQDKPSRMPEREVQTGVGAVKVKAPRVRDRGTDEKIRFQSGILPKYVRRTKSLEALILRATRVLMNADSCSRLFTMRST